MKNNLRSIKSAMFDCPKDFVSSREYYIHNLQQKIDDTYEWASNNFEIGQEITAGTLNFTKIICRITQAIHPKTGLNRGDDYRELKFLNTSDKRVVGKRYKFDDSTWICTNTDNYSYSTKSQIVRRCNNQITYINNDGEICYEPCIIDYAMKYSNVYYNNEVDIPQGTIIVITQNNDFTNKIQINDRFIFNNQTFKVKSQINYLRNDTEEIDSVLLKSFEMYVDQVQPDDNMELKIANFSRYKEVYPPRPKIINGTKISPELHELLQGRSVDFECYYIEDQVQTEYKYEFITNWYDEDYYEIKILDGNHFTVTNKHKRIDKPLTIKCVCENGQSKEINIILGGLF